MKDNRNKNYKSLLKMAFFASPGYFFVLLANCIIGYVKVYVNVWVAGTVVDMLSNGYSAQQLVWIVGMWVLPNAVILFLSNVVLYFQNVTLPRVREILKEKMSEKIMELPYSYLEDAYYMDLAQRSVFAISEQGALYAIVLYIADLCKNAASVLAVVTIMFRFSKFYTLFGVLIMAFIFMIYSKYMFYQKEFYDNAQKLSRREAVYKNIFFDKKFGMDLRLNHMKNILLEKYKVFMKYCYELNEKFFQKKSVFEGILNLSDALILVAAYIIIGLRVVGKTGNLGITTGEVVMYVTAISDFASRISKISENAAKIQQTEKLLQPYFEFMSIEVSEKRERKCAAIEKIEFRNVSFKYAHSDEYVLKDISFSVRKNEIIFIAGLNGSGKSTILKLLAKMYVLTEGEILVNDININEYDTESYLEQISAVFQDFRLFNYSIKQNVTFEEETDEKIEELMDALKLRELRKAYPQGINTVLNRDFNKDGIELSGGMSQKIALARAVYKKSSVLLLDEPTSAMDFISESNFFENMRKLNGNRIGICVSHRMFSCKISDRVLLIENGRLMAQGKHEELIETNSLYRDLCKTQEHIQVS